MQEMGKIRGNIQGAGIKSSELLEAKCWEYKDALYPACVSGAHKEMIPT